MASFSSASDTSSESASSEPSLTVSSQPATMEPLFRPPNPPKPSVMRRSPVEIALISQASEALVSSIESYGRKMASSQTAYFYSEAKNLLDRAVQKQSMKSIKSSNLDRTLSLMSDTASMVGSAIAYPNYPQSVNQSLYPPSVVLESSRYWHNHQPRRDPHDVNSEMGLPNDSFRFTAPQPKAAARPPATLLQAIGETEDEVEAARAPRKKRNSNPKPQARKTERARAAQSESETEEDEEPQRSREAPRKKRNSIPKARRPQPSRKEPTGSESETDEEEDEVPQRSREAPRKKRNSIPKASRSEHSQKAPNNKDSASSSGVSSQPQHSPHSSDSESDEDAPSPPKVAKPTQKAPQKSKATKVIKLHEWRLRVVGEDMLVAGFAPDRSRMLTGPVKRYSHPVIVAANGEFTVEGPPVIGTTAPKYLASYCKNGFPRQWKALTKKWIADLAAAEKKKLTSQAKQRKIESKVYDQGSSKNTKKPRPSASSTPKQDENPKSRKVNSSKNLSGRRLSKSLDKSSSVSRSHGKKVVQPRAKSELRSEKKPRDARPPSESESEESESSSESGDERVEEPPKSKKLTTKGTKESKVQKNKATSKETSAVPNSKPSTSKKENTERRPKNNFFGDSSEEESGGYRVDPFANMGDDERISLGKMTPNSLMKSVEPEALHLGRHTPPMTHIQHLFESGTRSMASTGSPSSLNTSRDNPVARRMNKDLVEAKKPKKRKPAAGVENRNPRLDEALKFLQPASNQNMRTPNLIKKAFRPPASTDCTDDDADESMVV